jgi:ribosomal protein S18 acetylase RimI-like enzyme
MLSFPHLTAADLPDLWKLATKIWNESYSSMITQAQIDFMLPMMYAPAVVQREFDEGKVWKYITANAVPIGFISVYAENNTLILNKLYLDSSVQGKGFGQLALGHVVQIARDLGCTTIRLFVNRANFRAIAAYERFGFCRTGERDFEIGGGFVMDDYIFTFDV